MKYSSLMLLFGSSASIIIENGRHHQHHAPSRMPPSSNSSSSSFSSSSSSSSDNNGQSQSSASETVCKNGQCKQVTCKDGKCNNAKEIQESEEKQLKEMGNNFGQSMFGDRGHFGQSSMFGDDFMKPMRGFGSMSFGDMGFPAMKMPKMPSFQDLEGNFGGFGQHMRDEMNQVPKMMQGMEHDPNSNMQSQSWSSNSSQNMGKDHKLHQQGGATSQKTECRNGVCHTVQCQNGKCEIKDSGKKQVQHAPKVENAEDSQESENKQMQESEVFPAKPVPAEKK